MFPTALLVAYLASSMLAMLDDVDVAPADGTASVAVAADAAVCMLYLLPPPTSMYLLPLGTRKCLQLNAMQTIIIRTNDTVG